MIEVQALVSIFGLGLLALFFYGPWQAHCVDKARQSLFVKRADLFDLACAGAIDFDDGAYVAVRSHIERLIRFSHNLTWLRFVFLLPFVSKFNLQEPPDVRERINSVADIETRKIIQHIYDDSGFIMLDMLVMKSPALLCMKEVLKLLWHGVRWISRMNEGANQRLQTTTARLIRLMQQTQGVIRAEADATRS